MSQFIIAAMLVSSICMNVNAEDFDIKNYGHFTKMVHMKDTEGVVNLKQLISPVNSYAVGAIQQGLGEITIINSKVWLDYGSDGVGNALNLIPSEEQAVLLVTSQVKVWESAVIHHALSKEYLFKAIIEKARESGINVEKPFPFQLEGNFNKLLIHVINGKNSKFNGHGGNSKLYNQIKEERENQVATIVGFYSAHNQGVYTHKGESWHMHAVIKGENIGAHVDGISTNKNIKSSIPREP